jgi:hypothetical protein
MISAIIGFFTTHFLETILTILVGSMVKQMVDQVGANRAELIRETVISAMYWAEQKFGIASGPLKWEKAWRMIREILEDHNIKLKPNEEKEIEVMMESYVPEINATTYSALPEDKILKRDTKSAEYDEWIEYLRDKYIEETKAADEQNK